MPGSTTETLGELIVRLGMDQSSFEKGLKDLNNQTKTAMSEIKAFGKSATDSGTNLEFLNTKSSSLAKAIEAQQKKIELYNRELDTSGKRIENLSKSQQELTDKVSAAKQAYENSVAAKGRDADETQELKAKLDALNQELEANGKMLDRAASGYENKTQKLNYAKGQLADYENELEKTSDQIGKLENKLYQSGEKLEAWGKKAQTAGEQLEKAGKSISGLGDKMTLGVTAPIVAFGTGATKAAMDFEQAFVGVTKTVDMTETEMAAMREGIIKMSEELPHAKENISAVAQAAGHLGINKENIMEFTEVMLNMGIATDMTAEQAATAMARFANIMGMPEAEVSNLGSTIVDLGNNFATTEAEIMNMGLRIAGAGKSAKMSEGDVMGIATALTSVGINAEAGGTAISRVITQMQQGSELMPRNIEMIDATGMSLRDLELMADNSSMGFKELADSLGYTSTELKDAVKQQRALEDFARVAGMTGEEFKKAFEEDAAGALSAFILGLKDLDDEGESVSVTLQEMGLKEIRVSDALRRSANASELFADALKTGNEAYEENIALTKEAEKFNETFASKFQVLKNEVNSLAIEVGDDLLPVLEELLDDTIKPLIKEWKNLDDEQKKNILKWAAIAAGVGPVLSILGRVVSTAGSVTKGFGSITSAIGDAVKASAAGEKATTGLGKAFQAITSPTGLVITALGAIATAVILAEEKERKYRESLEAAMDTTEEFAYLTEDASAEIQAAMQGIAEADEEVRQAYQKMADDAVFELGRLRDDSTVVSEEIKNSLITRFAEMGDGIKQEISTRTQESVTTFATIFGQTSVVADEKEAEILQTIIDRGKEQEDAVTNTGEAIKRIIETAFSEGRTLAEGEIKEITRLLQQMNDELNASLVDNTFAKGVLKKDIEMGLVQPTKEGYDQVMQAADDYYSKAKEGAGDMFAQALAAAERFKGDGSDTWAQMTAAAEANYNKTLEKARINSLEIIKVFYDENKAYVDGLVERANRQKEIEAEIAAIKSQFPDRAGVFGGPGASPEAMAASERKAALEQELNDIKILQEEMAMLDFMKPLYESAQQYGELSAQSMQETSAAMYEALAGLVPIAQENIAGIVETARTNMEQLPDVMSEYGLAGGLALVDALAGQGELTFQQAQNLKEQIIKGFGGIETETGAIGQQAADAIRKNLMLGAERFSLDDANAFLKALSSPMEGLPPLLEGLSEEAAKAAIDTLKNNGAISEEQAAELGKMIDAGLENGIVGDLDKVKTAAGNLTQEGVLDPLAEKLETGSPSRKAEEFGTWFDEGLIIGLDKKKQEAIETVRKIGQEMLDALKAQEAEYERAGSSLAEGMISGFESKGASLASAARVMAREALEAMKRELDVRSPSRKAYAIFENVGFGAVNALDDAKSSVAASAYDISKAALRALDNISVSPITSGEASARRSAQSDAPRAFDAEAPGGTGQAPIYLYNYITFDRATIADESFIQRVADRVGQTTAQSIKSATKLRTAVGM